MIVVKEDMLYATNVTTLDTQQDSIERTKENLTKIRTTEGTIEGMMIV